MERTFRASISVCPTCRHAGRLDGVRDVVLQRLHLRESEWLNPKINKVINDAEHAKTIAWNPDGSGNGMTTLIEQQRSFALKN